MRVYDRDTQRDRVRDKELESTVWKGGGERRYLPFLPFSCLVP